MPRQHSAAVPRRPANELPAGTLDRKRHLEALLLLHLVAAGLLEQVREHRFFPRRRWVV